MKILAKELFIFRVADYNPTNLVIRDSVRQGNYRGKSQYSEHLLITASVKSSLDSRLPSFIINFLFSIQCHPLCNQEVLFRLPFITKRTLLKDVTFASFRFLSNTLIFHIYLKKFHRFNLCRKT